MTRKSPIKKVILASTLVFMLVLLSGCRIPTDETGAIKQITLDTTFSETMSSENWFNAILVWPLAQALNTLAPRISVAGALTIVTVVVNLVLMLLTMKSTIASQQMQMLQPEMDKITRKYEGKTDENSRMRQANEVQQLYRKYNVNPMSMILVQFIQFPVIIAMYQSVQRAVAIKQGTFLGLSLSTTPMEGIRSMQLDYLVIFGTMALCQYLAMTIPQELAKKRAREEAEKHHRAYHENKGGQNRMMQYYMLAMICVFGLMWPSAMSVYWSINSLVAIAKTYIVQMIINNRKEASA